MSHFFSYRDADLYSHHTVDFHPDSDGFTMHAHEWLEILYILSGQGTCMVEGNQYPIEAGDLFLFRPSEMHRLILGPEQPYERIVIHFDPALLHGTDPQQTLLRPFYDRSLRQQNRYSRESDPDGLLRTAFSSFTFDHVPNIRLNLTARLTMVLTALDGLYGKSQMHTSAEGLAGQLVAYVNEHLFEDISIQSIADVFYRSSSQISRVFRQAAGTSLWDYVIIKRLMTARAMIQRGEPAITASSACGFSDYSAFYRAYRKQFGHSPRMDAPK